MSIFFRKSIMAATGLFLCIFLIVHLSANSLLLLPETIARNLYNSYSATLRESIIINLVGYILYLSILLHIIFAAIITYKNSKARTEKYALNHKLENSSWASQNMGFLGLLIFVFIVIHLANFWARIKLGIGENVGLDVDGYVDVYQVTYVLFHNIYYVLFYSILMIPLGFHLFHGLKSAFKSLGFHHKKGLRIIAKISLIYAAVMAIGFGVIPLIVYFK